MLDKLALDGFANKIGLVKPGSPADFALKHYKAILGGLAGVYALSKIIPAMRQYSHNKKVEENEQLQSALLNEISVNEARQTAAINPFKPKKDTYNYVF